MDFVWKRCGSDCFKHSYRSLVLIKKLLNNLYETWCEKWFELIIIAALFALVFMGVTGKANADHGVYKDDVTTVTVVCPNEEALIPVFELWLKGPSLAEPGEAEAALLIFQANGCIFVDNGAARVVSIQKRGLDYEGDDVYLIEIHSLNSDNVAYTIVWHDYVLEHASREATQ